MPRQKNLHLNTATDNAILQDKGSWIRYRHRRADFVFGSTADDLRDSPFERKAISARFEDELNDYHKRFRRIGGDRMSRVRQVAVWLQELS